MSHYTLVALSIVLCILVVLSGFFSLAETALISVNRYRLRHKARMKKGYAILILKLLKRPDRLLGTILVANSLASIVASAIATLVAVQLLGEKGVIISTLIASLIFIFAEVAPKTVAAIYPDKVSRAIVYPIYLMVILFYPVVWIINLIVNALLRLMHVNVSKTHHEALSRDELRSVVYDTAGKMSRQYQGMLLGILDLNKVTVDDVMTPAHEIVGINTEQPWDVIKEQLARSEHDWLPVYHEEINQILGVLHLRDLTAIYTAGKTLDKETLVKKMKEPYFVPQGTPLNIQLMNFQRQRKRLAMIVDEYGEVQGLVSVEDILEEIVGEFTTNVTSVNKIVPEADGSYLVDGALTIRDLIRATQWEFPVDGPRTLNGLIIEYLESMPHAGTCVKIAGYPIEIILVKDNIVATARIFPRLQEPSQHDV